eukprot:COSAG02_NODE_28439_length_589_cov_1.536735_1_plen_24_part_01
MDLALGRPYYSSCLPDSDFYPGAV